MTCQKIYPKLGNKARKKKKKVDTLPPFKKQGPRPPKDYVGKVLSSQQYLILIKGPDFSDMAH